MALAVGLLITACGGQWQLPNYMVAPAKGVVASCPPEVIGQARWVQANLPRVQLASPRRAAVNVLGYPAHVESFLLADNSAVDVLFYHTPETACRPMEQGYGGLMPLVFQNDSLLGYGQGYYHTMVVPNLRQPLGMPLQRSLPTAPQPNAQGGVGRGEPIR
ncbi:MAG: hypothetical protein WAZ18_02075 [Alphaproteobacteria bacterium]